MSDEWLPLRDVPGFMKHKLEVRLPGLVGSARLRIDGQPAPEAGRRGEYLLVSDDGRQVKARFRNQLFGLDVPQLEVGNKTLDILPPLKWYLWIWAAVPFVLVAFGAVGGLVGALALWFNIRLLRKPWSLAARLAATLGVGLLALSIWFVLAYILYEG